MTIIVECFGEHTVERKQGNELVQFHFTGKEFKILLINQKEDGTEEITEWPTDKL